MNQQTKQQIERLMQDQYNKITALQSENRRLREALRIANDGDLKDQYCEDHANGEGLDSNYGSFLAGWNKCLEVITEEAQTPGQVGETTNKTEQ